MKIGMNTLLWTAAFDHGHFPLLTHIREWGFDGVEIARFDYTDFPAATIRKALGEHGLGVTACSAFTGEMSFVTPDAAIRAASREFLKRAIESAAELGAPVLVGPYVSPVGRLTGQRMTEDEWSRAVEELSALGTVLDQHNVDLALEPLNRFECYTINTAQDAARLCHEIGHPRIGILFDTFHANIEEKNLRAALETAGPHIKHVHACENDRGIPGSGHVDWKALAEGLHKLSYDRWVVIESFGSRIPEIAAAACIWRDLAPEPDLIASEGVQFLRWLFSPETDKPAL